MDRDGSSKSSFAQGHNTTHVRSDRSEERPQAQARSIARPRQTVEPTWANPALAQV